VQCVFGRLVFVCKVRELKQTPITPKTTFTSLDITNVYSNIPCYETKQILKNMLSSNMTDHMRSSDILNCFEVITKQNYFSHGDKTITQTDGLAMGAPSSGIISEIFLQHFEHSYLPILPMTPRKLTNTQNPATFPFIPPSHSI